MARLAHWGCILYAAMHNQREAMDWILKRPLDNVLPRMEDAIRLQDEDITYETQKVVLEWIASKSREDIESEPTVMLCAAQQGHLQSFRELYEKGQPVTAVIAERAAFYRRINILEAIYEIDPSLVCKWDIFDLVSIGDGRFWKSIGKVATHRSIANKTCGIHNTALNRVADQWRIMQFIHNPFLCLM